ncbi:diguanylate cyclase domain-containing protein [Vibrio marisflavi]|uniref:Sensor domain-containing diguanylate cyclase n=1 Tax=Vibrio marisflavi CECT 7928 TaxID=634439 RepID=A0ABM8ZYK3_9VIBR|nr:diguanylate cyclase [Vibrio marisflavi]CAH0536025.1 hypothetical protein VMF7928_00121 [Vibrio marisflavi CECT 7928]
MILNSNHNNKIVSCFLTLAYVVVAFIAIQTLTKLFVERTVRESEERIQQNLSLVRSKIEAAIFTDVYLGDSLVTVVSLDPEFAVSNWPTIASKLLLKGRYIRNVSIIRGSVITHVYPFKGNEKALGLDLKSMPDRHNALMLARQMQTVHISGPLELITGGKGIVARYPIFSDFPMNKHYWGSVSVVLNYDALIKESGLSDVTGAEIAMRKQEVDGGVRGIFYGPEQVFDNPDAIYPVNLPSGKWLLAAKYQLSSIQEITNTRVLVQMVSIMTALLIYVSLALFVRNYQYAHQNSLEDELTKLPNRRFILNYINRLLQRSESLKFAILNIDINDFKVVNDTLGHEAGDKLLKFVAEQLKKSTRSTDKVARFGGDEFIVLLQDIGDEEAVEKITNHIRRAFKINQMTWQGNVLRPELSIGYTIQNGQTANIVELLAKADFSMYEDKKRTKGL